LLKNVKMIRIWFKDIAWIDSDGNVIRMDLANEIVVNTRLNHAYRTPVITEDTWNGRTFPVQINVFEGYNIQFGQRELSINDIAKLQSCKEIYVESLETNEMLKVDTDTSGQLGIEPLERLSTSNQGFVFNFVAKRIPTYPGLARLNTHTLTINYNSTDYNFYTDYDFIQFVSDAERSDYQLNSGINYTAKTIQKKGYRIVFYLMESDALSLKEKLEVSLPENVSFNTTIIPIESARCQLTALTEELYKCEVELVTEVPINYNV